MRKILTVLSDIFKYTIRTPAIWIPLVVLVAATLIFRVTDLDLKLSQVFFVDDGESLKSETRWPLRVVEPWKSLYYVGLVPAWIMGLGGLLVFFVSFFWDKIKSWRDAGLFLALMLALGPGLLVNSILKPYWSRPRPYQTTYFGGEKEYLPVGDKGHTDGSFSFPSGHASMGFYLMAPGFLLYQRNPRLARLFFAIGIACGIIMGFTRIVAGDHFASDVLWSAGIVYFTGLGLSALFQFGKIESSAE